MPAITGINCPCLHLGECLGAVILQALSAWFAPAGSPPHMLHNPEFCDDSPSQSHHLSAESIPAAMCLATMQARSQRNQSAEQEEGSIEGTLEMHAPIHFVARSVPKRRPDERIPAYMPRVAISTPLPLSRQEPSSEMLINFNKCLAISAMNP